MSMALFYNVKDSEFAIDSSLEEDDSGSDDSSEVNIYSALNIF
jgi:hypothetical protein